MQIVNYTLLNASSSAFRFFATSLRFLWSNSGPEAGEPTRIGRCVLLKEPLNSDEDFWRTLNFRLFCQKSHSLPIMYYHFESRIRCGCCWSCALLPFVWWVTNVIAVMVLRVCSRAKHNLHSSDIKNLNDVTPKILFTLRIVCLSCSPEFLSTCILIVTLTLKLH